MQKQIGNWKLTDEWTINGTWAVRYYYHGTTIQISKYRKADAFDKHMGNKYKWHGKWYVDNFSTHKVKLFNTKSQAISYATNYMKKHPKG